MQLTLLGKETQGGGSPTLFATDQSTYVVQGWKVASRPASVEIPQRLLGYLEPHTCLKARLDDTGHGSFILSGAPVTDPEALAQLDIPGHETCVEVAKGEAATEGSTVSGVATG
jgi:hypothetical protein